MVLRNRTERHQKDGVLRNERCQEEGRVYSFGYPARRRIGKENDQKGVC